MRGSLSETDLFCLQNWIAYQSLENAAKLKVTQQILDFPNDEPPKEEYHNAFCQVKIFRKLNRARWILKFNPKCPNTEEAF